MSNIIDRFHKEYPELKLVKTTAYNGNQIFIIAESRSGEVAMDPYFVYNKNEDRFYSYQPMANFDEFTKLLRKANDGGSKHVRFIF